MLASMNAQELIFCFLPSVGLWIAVFCAPSIPHAMELLITKRPMTSSDVEDFLLEGSHFKLLQLYSCTWCQGFWTSVLAGTAYGLLFGSFLLFPVYILFYYPVTMTLIWTLLALCRKSQNH